MCRVPCAAQLRGNGRGRTVQLACPGYTVEELYDPSIQGILCSDDEEPILLDQLLEDF